MKILLSILFALSCIVVLVRVLKEFRTGFDWFSGSLYFIIWLVSCSLIYVAIFGSYYLVLGELA
jgi:hypothetical protein|tara:strand:- start:4466 stop:4657 length:192 start_codon:yes stop_codon:yes gene_type:complete